MEADIFGGKNAPATPPAAAPPRAATPPALPPAPPPRPVRPRVVNPDEGQMPPAESRTGFVIELATAGFASGALNGGLFLGARLSPDVGGLIVGGSLDFASSSTSSAGLSGASGSSSSGMSAATTTTATTSSSSLSLGGGVRYTFVSANDGRLDLFGAGDVGIVYSSVDSASGFTVAAGPGLRLWVTDHVAVGYLARFRLTKLSGSNGAGDATTAGFGGTFQILGVF
jgi:hypothetical protein